MKGIIWGISTVVIAVSCAMLVYCGQCKIIDFSKFETVSNWKTVQNGVKKGSCTFAVLLYVGAFESSFNHVSLLDKFCIMTTNEIIFLIKKHESWKIPEKSLIFLCHFRTWKQEHICAWWRNKYVIYLSFSSCLPLFTLQTSQLYLFLCDCFVCGNVDFLFFQFSLQYFWTSVLFR